jgi:hypothetical protein
VTKSKKFVHKEVEYEVRAARFDHGYKVQVFRGDQPVSPPYTVGHETAIDFETAGWGNAVDALMALARDDIENGRLPSAKAA